ncbi:MAG TPA: hypothetical protein VHY20_05475 [Pirellulales bacterium]|nr:hypothetical protein [Pirellulales bacterium]
MCRCIRFLPTFSVAIIACWPLAILAADPDSSSDRTSRRTEVQLPTWAFDKVSSASSATDDEPTGDDGPVLADPQSDAPLPPTDYQQSPPPAPLPPSQAASSRRQWLSLARRTTAAEPKTTEIAADDNLVLLNDGVYLSNWLEASAAATAAKTSAWSQQRLKRALIEHQVNPITYSCEQTGCEPTIESTGPRLFKPQQATSLIRLQCKDGPDPLQGAAEAPPEKLDLDEGEPAKVILDIREQVGPKLLEGTIFGEAGWRARATGEAQRPDSHAVLVRCIRDLAQDREACDDTCESHCEFAEAAPPEVAATPPAMAAAVPALRQASRQLDQMAELLEEQKLYDRADQLRDMAQQMREQARAAEGHPSATAQRAVEQK